MGALPPPPPLLLLLLFAAIAQSKITSDRGRWWPNGRVFYRIHFGVDSALVHGAMAAIEARTCVRFIENDFLSTQHHIDVVAGDDCFSDIGYKHSTNAAAAFPDLQLLSLGPRCASKGIALHEIGHALGLSHEHNRLDRDLYVRVLPRNVRQGRTGEFYRKSELEHFGVPYDVGSIMHYSARTFAREGVNAMLPLDENFHQTMGQRGDMTFYDAKLLNMAYCRESCGASDLPCQNSGYPNPNDCALCLCPSEFTGRFCETISSDDACPPSELIARSEWQLLRFASGGSCTWRIKTESPKLRVEFRLKSVRMNVSPHGICDDDFVEVKYKADFGLSGARFCYYGPEQRYLDRSTISDLDRIFVRLQGGGGAFSIEYREAEVTVEDDFRWI